MVINSQISVSLSDSEHKITFEHTESASILRRWNSITQVKLKLENLPLNPDTSDAWAHCCAYFSTFTTANKSFTLFIHRMISSKFLYFYSVKIYWNNWIPGEKIYHVSTIPTHDNLTGQKTHALHHFILWVSSIPLLCLVARRAFLLVENLINSMSRMMT